MLVIGFAIMEKAGSIHSKAAELGRVSLGNSPIELHNYKGYFRFDGVRGSAKDALDVIVRVQEAAPTHIVLRVPCAAITNDTDQPEEFIVVSGRMYLNLPQRKDSIYAYRAKATLPDGKVEPPDDLLRISKEDRGLAYMIFMTGLVIFFIPLFMIGAMVINLFNNKLMRLPDSYSQP